VEQKYKRIDDLDQKIKKISLPYLEWKVLFLVAENTSIPDIAEYISEEKDVLEKTLTSLEEKGLIAQSTGEELVTEETKEAEKPEEVAEIDLKEEVYEEAPIEEETKIQVSEVPEEESSPETEPLDFEEPIDEAPEDVETEMPELIEEDSEPLESVMAVDSEPETQEAETAPVISEDELMPETTEEKPVEKSEVEEESDVEEIVSDGSKKSIMVIDDSIVIRKMIEIALEDEDYSLLNATTGKEGMDVIEKEKPNLVILDMLLPDMNGIDVLKKIKESIDIPVIMLSGKDSPQLVENAKEFGVNDFLPKPFKDEELVEKVKSLIGV